MGGFDLVISTLGFLDDAITLALREGGRRFRENCEKQTGGQALSAATEMIKADVGNLVTVNLLSKLWVVGALVTPLQGLFSAFGIGLSRPAEAPETMLLCLLFSHMLMADEEIGEFVQAVVDAAFKSGSNFLADPTEKVLCKHLVRLGVLRLPDVQV